MKKNASKMATEEKWALFLLLLMVTFAAKADNKALNGEVNDDMYLRQHCQLMELSPKHIASGLWANFTYLYEYVYWVKKGPDWMGDQITGQTDVDLLQDYPWIQVAAKEPVHCVSRITKFLVLE